MVTEKGHKNEFEKFLEMVKKGSSEYDFEANVLTTMVTLKAVESIQNGVPSKL
jgi:Trp operon repressor